MLTHLKHVTFNLSLALIEVKTSVDICSKINRLYESLNQKVCFFSSILNNTTMREDNLTFFHQLKYKLTLCLAALLVLSACQESTQQINKTPVTIAVSKTPLSAPFFIAQKLKFFEQSCVNVTIDETIGGKRSFEKVVNGEADFGTSSDSVIVFKGLVRSDFSALTTFVQSDNDVKIVTLTNSNIRNSKHLVGKRIGLTKGTAGEYFLSTYLAISGIDINQVTIKNLAPDKLQQALEQEQVDVIVPWEPYAYRSIHNAVKPTRLLNTKNLYTLTFNLVSKKLKTDEQLKSAQCVIGALQKAINYIIAEPKDSQHIIIEHLGLNQAFINWVWPDYIFKLSLNRSFKMDLESQAQWALKTGMISQRDRPDFTNIMDTRALLKVNANAITIK